MGYRDFLVHFNKIPIPHSTENYQIKTMYFTEYDKMHRHVFRGARQHHYRAPDEEHGL
jgi:hypothetical protein